MKDENKIIVTNEKNERLEGELIFEFSENGDDYVVYGIGDTMYVAKYNENHELFPVGDDEWPLIEKIIEDYFDNLGEDVDS